MPPPGAVKLGQSMYLFESATDLHNCVIDAHGGYLFENRSFTVPAGVALHFYSDHGSSVMDPGRGALELSRRHHRAVVRETLSEGDTCHNYLLSKSWGDHIHKGEPDKQITYGVARDALGQQDRHRNLKVLYMRQWLMANGKHGVPVDHDTASKEIKSASLLTVRNRWDYLAITLKHAIKQARARRPTLTVFHCNFCRVPAFPEAIASMLNQTTGPDQDLEFR